MEDVKGEVSQAQRNQSQAYVEMSDNLKRHDKSEIFKIGGNSQLDLVANAESHDDEDDGESDIISELIGHKGSWQLFWAFLLCLFQFPTTFHIFCLVFQVSSECNCESEISGLASGPCTTFFSSYPRRFETFQTLVRENHKAKSD